MTTPNDRQPVTEERLRAIKEYWRTVDSTAGYDIRDLCAALEEARAEIAQEERDCEKALKERDDANDTIQRIHVALGGDGEWCAKPGQVCLAGETGDLAIDTPVLAEELRAQLAAKERECATMRKALQAADQVFSVAFDGSCDALTPCHDEIEAIKAVRSALQPDAEEGGSDADLR